MTWEKGDKSVCIHCHSPMTLTDPTDPDQAWSLDTPDPTGAIWGCSAIPDDDPRIGHEPPPVTPVFANPELTEKMRDDLAHFLYQVWEVTTDRSVAEQMLEDGLKEIYGPDWLITLRDKGYIK